jgi:hypothetical protein
VIGRKAVRRRRDRETERQRDGKRGEDATMRNESKDHRKYANMYSMDCRTGEESNGSSVLERGRRDKAGGSIGSEDDLV